MVPGAGEAGTRGGGATNLQTVRGNSPLTDTGAESGVAKEIGRVGRVVTVPPVCVHRIPAPMGSMLYSHGSGVQLCQPEQPPVTRVRQLLHAGGQVYSHAPSTSSVTARHCGWVLNHLQSCCLEGRELPVSPLVTLHALTAAYLLAPAASTEEQVPWAMQTQVPTSLLPPLGFS